jgi:acyl-coenzyme A synthetase/AMP-(fatty) acid ligase
MDDGHYVTTEGTVGEVYVVSPALALAYYHDPEKTKAVFVEIHKPDGMTARALKTGDLAKYDADGNLIFVSRKDFQIKHMGRRIELGEIESVADTIPEVQRCCCLYDEKRKMIKLFCELVQGCDWDGRAVQSAMRGRISDYMLPGKVIILEQLPLNANGKTDRTKLKEML